MLAIPAAALADAPDKAGPVSPTTTPPPTAAPAAAHPVATRIKVRSRAINAAGPGSVQVHGRLLPGSAGHEVELEGLRGGWHELAHARTTSTGAFDLRYTPHVLGRERLRVVFGGNDRLSKASAPAGSVTAYEQTVASWYEDGGETACGFHAYYGVANLSLPCGTQVKFMNDGHTVSAVVDDRGPYVGGRDFDLNQNTAGALGFAGVGAIWSTK
jgi:rare lipoprotein A